jgi:hypothetical protein
MLQMLHIFYFPCCPPQNFRCINYYPFIRYVFTGADTDASVLDARTLMSWIQPHRGLRKTRIFFVWDRGEAQAPRGLPRRSAKHRAYISRREVKVFGVKIFLYEWALTAKVLCGREISKPKIIYFSKRPRFCVC